MAAPGSKKAKAQKAKRKAKRTSMDNEERAAQRQAQQTRRVEMAQRRSRRRRQRRQRDWAIGGAVVLLVVAGLWWLLRPAPELDGVTRPPDRGGGHTRNATYDSATPTSGAHNPSAPNCGTYGEPLAPDLAVHALEHGTVVLWHDAARPEIATELEEATREFDSHVIISASTQLEDPIVATAWNRLKAYEPGDPEITEFVETYRKRGPEKIDCDL